MSRKTVVKPEEALNKYLELGQGRSLNKLNKIKWLKKKVMNQ